MASRPERRLSHATRCAVCDGQFGLVRHYQWRTQLCSTKCVTRFRARRENDRTWLSLVQIAWDAQTKASAMNLR
jgi:formate-dependent nitrite reductase cytochrome c552 subunit